MHYLHQNNIINLRQYGFRLKSNPTPALFGLNTTVQFHLDRQQKVVIIFIELQKIFDTVKRNKLLKKAIWNIVRSRCVAEMVRIVLK